MERNVVFCFTGTGNSLKVAKDIAAALGDCEIFHMGSANAGFDVSAYARVGFVFPVYFVGLPMQVRRFVEGLGIPPGFPGYFFCVGTYANVMGNAVRQVGVLLGARGHRLGYAGYVKMGDNAIAFYGSNPDLDKLALSYRREIAPIALHVKEKQTRRIRRPLWLFERYHAMTMPGMQSRDKGFEISDACTMCQFCVDACPAGNIAMAGGKPAFAHRCEQCMACIQLCPQKAIDYRGKCGKRRRYRHPDIAASEIPEFHKNGKVKMRSAVEY